MFSKPLKPLWMSQEDYELYSSVDTKYGKGFLKIGLYNLSKPHEKDPSLFTVVFLSESLNHNMYIFNKNVVMCKIYKL